MGLIPVTPALNLLPQAARYKSPLDYLPCCSRPIAGGGMSLPSIPTIYIKNEVIIKNFGISSDRIIHSDSALHKLVFLKEIYAQSGKPILFVEDTVSTLLRAEEDMDYVQGFHISGLIP